MVSERRETRLNEDFFREDSAEVWFILGLLVKTYIPIKKYDNGVIFRNRNYNIIELIKSCLECENKIRSDNREKNSHSLEVTNRNLRLSLEERGLTPNKEDRRFPTVPEKFIHSNIRGFVENGCVGRNNITKIILSFHHEYLVELNERLRYYAGVKKESITGDSTEYRIKDTRRIYDFIYQDASGLYIPGIKERFRFKTFSLFQLKRREAAIQKLRRVEELLRKGHKGVDIYRQLGFGTPNTFYVFVRRHTGKGIKNLIR